ncbi:MAG: hypothetical protein H0W68_08885 [Gemmatimonadaceae bacterium]|nr:hypothetical protein [Gemmatimonadaceae bacterium]
MRTIRGGLHELGAAILEIELVARVLRVPEDDLPHALIRHHNLVRATARFGNGDGVGLIPLDSFTATA